MACGACKGRKPTRHEAVGSTPENYGSDFTYPRAVWVVCPDSDEPFYFEGSQRNWTRAIGLASQLECPFNSSRVILPEAPSKGTWIA